MDKFRFLKWNVYKESKELFGFVLKMVKKMPKEYRFELGSQFIRSALSVVLNIAEGSGKTSDKELNRFLEIAVGSLNETLAGLDVLLYNKLISQEEFDSGFKMIGSISSQLGGFKKTLA